DPLMVRYFELLTNIDASGLQSIKSGALHPMEAKKRLASEIVTEYHGADAAGRAREYFESRFQRHEIPADAPRFKLDRELWICELMKQLRFASSTSEARRLVGQGAVRVDGRTITDPNFHFIPGESSVLEVGKRRVARIEP
ncbi:MAG: S4 domain-containing protein, partial [Candidatus Binataceae bacterium]